MNNSTWECGGTLNQIKKGENSTNWYLLPKYKMTFEMRKLGNRYVAFQKTEKAEQERCYGLSLMTISTLQQKGWEQTTIF